MLFRLLMIVQLLVAGDLRLVEAVKQKNAPLVTALLQQHVDVNAAAGDGTTALHWAAHWDDLATVDALIKAGAKVNVANDLGITPLALASTNGNVPIVERLLRARANSNVASDTGVTPLMQAARIGNAVVAGALLQSGANVNAKTTDRGQTALMIAAAEQHPEVVRVLLQHGADVTARTNTREYKVLVDRSTYRAAKSIQETGTQMEMGGTTALLFAAESGDLESSRLLLEAGAKVDDAESDGNTALVIATHSGHGSIAALLLDKGADPNASAGGYTALHAAALRRDFETLKALLAHGADPNTVLTRGTPVRRWTSMWSLPATLTGATPLLVAANYLEVDVMRILVAGGASVTAALPNGTTALGLAAGTQFEKLNRPLLDHTDTPTDIGDTCCERSETRALESVKFLLDSGADVNGVNKAGDTALHGAAASGFTTIIQLLADRGANLNVKNQRGQTPLSLASSAGQRGARPNALALKKAEELLRKLGATD